mgnify:CR=1 FL=1
MDTKLLMQLREATGAPITACKSALLDSAGDLAKATEILRKKGLEVVDKKAGRDMGEGLVDAYIHGQGKVGALVQVTCETDFVARTPQFKDFVHEVALQVAASAPTYVSVADIPAEAIAIQRALWMEEVKKMGKPEAIAENIVKGKIEKWYQEVCLLNQPYIKDEDKTVQDVMKETVAKLGENISIKRFVRFSL